MIEEEENRRHKTNQKDKGSNVFIFIFNIEILSIINPYTMDAIVLWENKKALSSWQGRYWYAWYGVTWALTGFPRVLFVWCTVSVIVVIIPLEAPPSLRLWSATCQARDRRQQDFSKIWTALWPAHWHPPRRGHSLSSLSLHFKWMWG